MSQQQLPYDPVIARIPREMIGAMFPLVAPHLLKGLATATDVTLESVVDDLVAGTDHLWAITHDDEVLAAFVTSAFLAEDGSTFIGVYGLGGKDIARWGKRLGETMTLYAKSQGAASVRFCGREAWSRVLPDFQITGSRLGEAVYERAVQ